jgi:hypothetical protein
MSNKTTKQFNNIVEPFSSSTNNSSTNYKKVNKGQSILDQDRDKLKWFFIALAICVGGVIYVTFMGANLIFYQWALHGYTRCSSRDHKKKLFDLIFPTEDALSGGNNQKGGGYLNEMRQCFKEQPDLGDYCKTSISGLKTGIHSSQFDNKILNTTNYDINNVIKMIITLCPGGDFCWVTFLLGWIIIPMIVVVVFFAAIICLLKNGGASALKYCETKPISGTILLIILAIGIIPIPGYTWGLASIYATYMSILVTMRLVFYPAAIGGKKTLLKIMQNNSLVINLLIWLAGLAMVITAGYELNQNIFHGMFGSFILSSIVMLYNNFYK